MQVLSPGQSQPPAGGTAVTIGAFDGVHCGHRALLEVLRAQAAWRGLPTAVVTFDRHPAAIVRPDSAPLLLTDLEHKLELLEECGIDQTLVVPFDQARAGEEAEEFVSEVLVGDLGARVVVVGADFHFGHGRSGDVRLLSEAGRQSGFEVVGLGLEAMGGAAVSSTRIRALLAEGAVREAADLLGRPHEVRGKVTRGEGRGGSVLGFPTANVLVPAGLAVPADGVYAGIYMRPDGSRHAAAISVGIPPTFPTETAGILVEAHLLDGKADLYGEKARVAFVARLRAQEHFGSLEDLVAQMGLDVAAARAILGTP